MTIKEYCNKQLECRKCGFKHFCMSFMEGGYAPYETHDRIDQEETEEFIKLAKYLEEN